MDSSIEKALNGEGAAPEPTVTEKEPTKSDSVQTGEAQSVTDLGAHVEQAAKTWEGFDPKVHAVDADGNPKKKSDGSWAMKRGRKPGSSNSAAPVTGDNPPLSAPKARAAGTVTNKAAARAMVATGVGLMCHIVGPEWEARDQSEFDGLADSVKDYFDARGQVQMGPETMLAITLLGYAVPRTEHPNTREKFGRFFTWAKNGLQALFKR
jgi:hypothetical protein